jgi:hypothetical protein
MKREPLVVASCPDPIDTHISHHLQASNMGSAADIDYTTLLGELTLEEKIKLLSGMHFSAGGGAERVGIPPLHVSFFSIIPPPSKTDTFRWPTRSAASGSTT